MARWCSCESVCYHVQAYVKGSLRAWSRGDPPVAILLLEVGERRPRRGGQDGGGVVALDPNVRDLHVPEGLEHARAGLVVDAVECDAAVARPHRGPDLRDEGPPRGARHQRAGLRPVAVGEGLQVVVNGRGGVILGAAAAPRQREGDGGEGRRQAPHSAASISRRSSAASGGSGVFASSGRSMMASTIASTWSARTPRSDSAVAPESAASS